MLKLTERSRKVLRAIYKGLGVTAVSMVFYSCPFIERSDPGWVEYGMPPDYPVREEFLIHGQVRGKVDNYKPIRGIAVVVEGINNHFPHITSSFGEFYIWVPKQENYTLIFTDIDSEKNGGRFKQLEITLTIEEIQALYDDPLLIDLELETETE